MATKSAPKKAVSTTTKKKVVKKSVAKSTPTKKAAAIEQPFFEFRITQQTLYWLILGAASITFALWLYTLDGKVRDLYDQIDANIYSSEIMPVVTEQPPADQPQPPTEE